MNKYLCSSMMCAKYGNLENEVKILEEAGIDIFHLDVMDGKFVPNFAMGLGDIAYICDHTIKKTEVHLMIENPKNYIAKFASLGVDIIYIHPESDYHPATTLQLIKEQGLEAGIALNPGTSVETILELLNIVDRVLVMGVNPGHAGQIYVPFVEKKVDKLLRLKEEYHFTITMDGACNADMMRRLIPRGVEGFVLGTAALFGKEQSYREIIQELRAI